MPKILIGISILFLTLSLVFGFLNTHRIRGLRNQLADAISARDAATAGRATSDGKLKLREAEFSAANTRATAAEQKAMAVEGERTKAQNEKAELESKLRASEGQVADLQKQIADATVRGGAGTEALNEMKEQLEDTRKQLEAAEHEKSVLADKVKAAQDRVTTMEEEKKRRESGSNKPGIHGKVLAVNQAYNFVVLGIGERQGVVPNVELLVMRNGAFIGKIRISSVEPTTSIGDIITNSLARGVQVQPGDTVIYGGSTNS
jgi:DNA gyrase/topoisomerase IV subunit A